MSSEEELIRSIAEGNQTAFQTLYKLYSAKVYNTALSYVQQVQDAEEVTQDVFTKIYRSAVKFEGRSSASTWIYRITVNSSLNKVKKNKRFSFLQFGPTEIERPDFEHPGVLLDKQENAKVLFKVIDTLAESQKTAFILSFVEGLPRQEVADIMDISLKAVESLLQRAKKNLQLKLEKIYPNRRKK